MPGKKPEDVKVYRIVHVNNIEYLLTNGIFNRDHAQADPAYVNIGDNDLIQKRHEYPVGINPPGGALGSYVPFYFGPLSPMLLNIKMGYSGVTKRPQTEIVYVVCRVEDIVAQCEEWCFSDGHAKTKITTFYNSLEDLNEVHWDKVKLRYWRATEDDFDRMRHKQAEFLVKNQVPVKCIFGLVTYNKDVALHVENILKKLGLNIPVKVDKARNYYY